MIFELRTYTAKPGRTADFLKLHEEAALALQLRHLGGLVGFYVTEVGPLNQIVHLRQFDSVADRERPLLAHPDRATRAGHNRSGRCMRRAHR